MITIESEDNKIWQILLAKTRKITSILQRSVDSLEGDLPYNNMAAQLADIIDCNAAIVNGGGALLVLP